jgi:hypothetical protein
MNRLLLITFFSIMLTSCDNSSTDSGIEQGTDTGIFAGDYEGTLDLELTADVVGYNPHSDSGSVPVEIEITEDGIVRLTNGNYTVEGIIDNNGDWKLEVAINEFSGLIDKGNKDALKQAGCPLDKPFIKIEGKVTTPDLLGDVSGKLTCKILFVTVASLEFFGTLTGST